MTIIEKIISHCNLPSVVKRKHGNTKEITSLEFISSILENNTVVDAGIELGIAEQTIHRIIKKYLIPIFGPLTGGNQTWRYVLLGAIQYKHCNCCNEIKPYSKFGLDVHNSDRKNRKCKYCRSFDNASLYSSRKLRIPPWHHTEKEQIANFYDNCPEGYHVDHIIPLQGSYVSGLHTLSNLQYLKAEDNIRKGNTYIV